MELRFRRPQATRDKDVTQWHRHFTWLPARMRSGNYSWLETVERKGQYSYEYGFPWKWKYREIR